MRRVPASDLVPLGTLQGVVIHGNIKAACPGVTTCTSSAHSALTTSSGTLFQTNPNSKDSHHLPCRPCIPHDDPLSRLRKGGLLAPPSSVDSAGLRGAHTRSCLCPLTSLSNLCPHILLLHTLLSFLDSQSHSAARLCPRGPGTVSRLTSAWPVPLFPPITLHKRHSLREPPSTGHS